MTPVTKAEMEPRIQSAVALIQTLFADVAEASASAHNPPASQTARRSYVRAVFACIEGTLWAMKCLALEMQYTVEAQTDESLTPSIGERQILLEKTYDLKDNGDVREKDLALRFEQNLKFTFTFHARVFQVARPPVSGPGWDALLTAQQVRHRLTHPKSALLLEVTDAERAQVATGFSWFEQQLRTFHPGQRAGSGQVETAMAPGQE